MIIRRIAALLMALLLMAAFYLYALLQEDEETKQTDQWVVAGPVQPLAAQETLTSTDSAQLAAAMGLPLLLPGELTSGMVRDSSYHSYRVRLLEAQGEDSEVLGVRPASAAPLIRPEGLAFESTDKTLLNAPLLRAQSDTHAFYYMANEEAAFIIRLPLGPQESDSLSAFSLIQP